MLPNSAVSTRNERIAIIGAGLMGRLCAVSLARDGFHVTLFDKDNVEGRQSAAYAAAGLLTPLGEAMHCEANIVEMGFISLTLWPQLLASLSGYTFFQQAGAIVVAHEQDQGDYARFQRLIHQYYPQHTATALDRQALLALEPEIARHFTRGLYLPAEGQLGNRKLLIALEQELSLLGIEWLTNTHVTAMNTVKNKVVVTGNAVSREFDVAIDCRGIGASTASAGSCAPLGDLRAVRGELFQLFAPDVTITRPIRLMHPRYQLYIAPKPNGHYVVGATEIESEDRSPMTVRSSMELLSAAYSVHSGFAEANIRQHVSQVRPAFNDNQPRIVCQNNIIQVNGLYRHGFLIAPVVLAQVQHALKVMQSETTSSTAPYQQLLPILNDEYENIY